MTPEEEARVAALEKRVAELELRLGPARPAPVVRPHSPPPPAVMPPPTAPRSPRRGVPSVENWISGIASVTVILALGFFFEYAFANHWITERMRVLLGLACGAVALGFGEQFWQHGRKPLGKALSAAGIAFFYLSFWAAFGQYHLVSQGAAFALMVVTAAAAGFLALRYDSPGVAMLGLSGGFATPLLLGTAQDPWFVLGYALVLDGGAAFAARLRRWRWPEAVALAGTVVLYANQSSAAPESRVVFTIFVLAYYGLFAASTLVGVFLAAQICAAAALAGIWQPAESALALAWLLAVAGLVVADRRGWPTAVSGAFVGYWVAYGIWYGGVSTPAAGVTVGLLTLAYLTFLAWPVWLVVQRSRALRFQDLTLVAANAGLYFGASYAVLQATHGNWVGLFAVAVAVTQMAAARVLWRHDPRGSMLAAGAAWVLLVLAAPIQFAGYQVTIAWAAEGAALVWIGTRMGERRAVHGSLAIFALVLLRLAIVDSRMFANPASYPLVANARLMAFAVAAASLWASAWWIRRGQLAMATYATGHFVMLWGLSLEAIGWAARSSSVENFRSFASTSISVLAAGYAVLLVAGGAIWKSPESRTMGVGLIGLVVVKLYLYDVWLLGAFYRMAAFAILGVLLLVMSYLYSKRSRPES